jgi:hypothetical protein
MPSLPLHTVLLDLISFLSSWSFSLLSGPLRMTVPPLTQTDLLAATVSVSQLGSQSR